MTALHVSLHEPGLWAEQRQPIRKGRPALFLDRDGVVVEEKHYLSRVADVSLTAGAGPAIAAANQSGLSVILVTNQAGVGRGYYDWTAFAAVQDRMHRELATYGAHIDAVFACAYHADGQGAYRIGDHHWRKPNPGMLERAISEYALESEGSTIIGDRASDIAAGKRAGIGCGILVETGYGRLPAEQDEAWALAGADFEVVLSSSLEAAVTRLLGRPR